MCVVNSTTKNKPKRILETSMRAHHSITPLESRKTQHIGKLLSMKSKISSLMSRAMTKASSAHRRENASKVFRTPSAFIRRQIPTETISNFTDVSMIDYNKKLQTQINDLKVADICK